VRRTEFKVDYDIAVEVGDLTPVQYALLKAREVFTRALGDRVLSIGTIVRCSPQFTMYYTS
jgi:hypothetical protein